MTVERKLKSLKTHFMSVHKAYAKRRLKADPGSIVKPKWFAYEALTFLNKGRLMRINRETPNVERQVRHENIAVIRLHILSIKLAIKTT